MFMPLTFKDSFFVPLQHMLVRVFSVRNVEMPSPRVSVGDVLVPRTLRDTADIGSLVPLPPLGPNFKRNCKQNADDLSSRVTADVSVPQDLKVVAEAVRLAESAPMPKTFFF